MIFWDRAPKRYTTKRRTNKIYRLSVKNESKRSMLPIAKTLVFLICVFVVALAYVWQHMQLVQMGFHIKQKEKELSVLCKDNESLTLRVSRMNSPQAIKYLIRHYNLQLEHTSRERVIQLHVPDLAIQETQLVQPQPGFMKLARMVNHQLERFVE